MNYHSIIHLGTDIFALFISNVIHTFPYFCWSILKLALTQKKSIRETLPETLLRSGMITIAGDAGESQAYALTEKGKASNIFVLNQVQR